MNYKMMGRFLALIVSIEVVFMIPALGIAIFDHTGKTIFGFALTIGIMVALATILFIFTYHAPKGFFAKEGFLCVTIGWIVMSLLGALPFVISQEIPNYIDALFETVSGFSTTGASIVENVEALSRATLYWRSFTHWLGGMGVLVFLLAVVPSDKGTGFTMHLFRAESPGPDVGKLSPKLKDTAKTLYITYIVLTVINFILLWVDPGMDAFYALCTAFGTAGTGGFGLLNDSIASYSYYVKWVTTIFMLLFGVNFSVYFLLLRKQFKSVLKDEELRFYGIIVTLSIVAITVNIMRSVPLYSNNFGEALTDSAFSVASIISTTGFATADFNTWPMFSKAILMLLMITGACAGSTCGGFKCTRIILLFKNLKRNILKLLHPNKVQPVRVNGNVVSESVVANTNAYLTAYVLLIVISFLLLALFDNESIATTFTAVLSCINNIGPGMEAVGPTCNYAFLSIPSKIVLILDMLAGRLEIFPLLVLFSPSLWKSAFKDSSTPLNKQQQSE